MGQENLFARFGFGHNNGMVRGSGWFNGGGGIELVNSMGQRGDFLRELCGLICSGVLGGRTVSFDSRRRI